MYKRVFIVAGDLQIMDDFVGEGLVSSRCPNTTKRPFSQQKSIIHTVNSRFYGICTSREDIFDTRKPRDNFAIGEIIEEKASLFMVFNLGSAFSALPYKVSINSWSPALQIII